MNDTIKIIFDMLTGIFAVIGFVFCIYYIFLRQKLYIKGSAYLILDTDKTGGQLEYYVRKIQGGNVKINKIILYSKSNDEEILNICGMLSRDYPDVTFYAGENIINLNEITGD